MSNESVYLPGKIRDRIQDLMKSRKITQAELATRIGCSESSLSRFISGKTDKLGDENIIRIAHVFNVSTDFLLGEVDTPDRLNYDISELGLSVQAARNLYTHKVNPRVVNALLENPEFANTTNLISGYLDDELAKGFAAQNQLYATVAGMLKSQPERREKLWTIAHALQNGLKADGMNIGITNSMVTPVYLSGSVAEGMQVVFDLRENYNIFCSIVVYPVIPKGQLLLRLIPTSMHTLEDVKYTIKAFKNVAEKLAKGEYNKELLIDASKL